jgi:hypothetical protein
MKTRKLRQINTTITRLEQLINSTSKLTKEEKEKFSDLYISTRVYRLHNYVSKMLKQTTSVFIYALCDPIEVKNEYHIYIGKSDNPYRRYQSHISWNHKTKKSCWIHWLLKQNLKPDLQILEQCENEESIWSAKERYWISFYRKCGYKVVNGTDGGEGCSHGYHIQPLQFIEKPFRIHKDRDYGCHFSKYILQRMKFYEDNPIQISE